MTGIEHQTANRIPCILHSIYYTPCTQWHCAVQSCASYMCIDIILTKTINQYITTQFNACVHTARRQLGIASMRLND